MPLVLSLPPEEEARFEAWATQQGESVREDAHAIYSAVAERKPWEVLTTIFFKALTLTQPVLNEAARQEIGLGQYLLILLQTMTALYHAHGGRPLTPAELAGRTPLQDAMTLYDLEVVSLGIAARIAHVSVEEFIDALSQAGISVFQYTAEEALAELAELKESSRRALAAGTSERADVPTVAPSGPGR